MIKLERLDPDWQFAARHGQASLVGYNSPSKSSGSTAICPCCFQLIYKQQIPLTVSSKQLEFLGFGFPLFYSFLKNCMILLIIIICSYNALSIQKAVDHNYYFCHSTDPNVQPHRRILAGSTSPTCTTFMIELARIEQTVPLEQQIIRIASFVLQFLYLIYMRDHITKLESYYDERNCSLSDYSIMLKNIPKQPNIQIKLREFFKKGFNSYHQIKQITLLPQYHQIEDLQKERIKIIDMLRQPYNKGELSEEDIKLQAALEKIEKAIHEEASNSKKLADDDQLQCEKVILVFDTDEEKSQILSQFQDLSLSTKGEYFGVGAEEIRIKEAPEPKQIIWKNVNVSQQKKIFLYVVSWGLSALVLILVTIFFYFVLEQKTLFLIESLAKLEKDKYNKKYISNYNSAVALAYIMLFLIIFFNKFAMSTLFYKFTQIERQQTRSKFQFSFGLKYLLGLFFTTALMTLAVEAIRFSNYYSHPYGVIQEQTIMFFLNAFFTPLIWLFNPFGLIKKLKRKLNYGKRGMTQEEANHLMESSHYDMGKRYAEIIQTMWFTFLYATLIPIGAFISLAGVALYFWVDKYTLLRKSSIGREVSGKIVLPNLKLLDVTLLLKPAGQMMFDIQIRHSHALVSTIVMLTIAALYILLPIGRIIEWFNPQSFNLEEKTYGEMKQSFKDTYHTQHPVYKLIHVDKLKSKLSKKGLIISSYSQTLQTLNQGRQEKTYHALLGKKPQSLTNLKQNNTINVESQTSKDLDKKTISKIGSMRF